MNFPLHDSVTDVNASIVATSSDETLFLSSTGDVLVCRDFDCHDDRYYGSESPAFAALRGNLDDCHTGDSGNGKPTITLTEKKEVAKNLWTDDGQHDDECSCCDVNGCHAKCLAKGLCGGAEDDSDNLHVDSSDSYGYIGNIDTSMSQSPLMQTMSKSPIRPTMSKSPIRPTIRNGSHHGSDRDNVLNRVAKQRYSEKTIAAVKLAKQRKAKSRNANSLKSSSANPSNINSKEYTKQNPNNQRGVTEINSSESFGRRPLSINTSRSFDDEEYDNVDINSVTLGDHERFLTVGSSSPTPVMSFDYSSYEPPTPEASRSYDYLDDEGVGASGKTMNERGTKHVSMPNLSEEPENHQLKGTINLPTGSKVPRQKEQFQPHPIPPRLQLNDSPEQHRSPTTPTKPLTKPTDYSSGLPGIPTSLNHLSQIRITRVSAHPKGHHVLLVSEECLLFSYGLNNRGQLGLGKLHTKSNAPQLITPLLENGGKTVNCAAGIDYSLVVVRTEGSRIAHRRRQQQQTNGSNATNINERNAHHQMYAFGCNDNMKLGLLDPEKSLNKSFSSGAPRRRWRGNGGDMSPVETPEPPSPSSVASTPGSVGDESTVDGSSAASTDVFLPRRVALHCKVIPKRNSPESPSRNGNVTTASPPYGIFSVAASTDHSAALVRRPSGAVELYTWGRGEEGKLGLPVPGPETLYPTRGWETLCCGSMDYDDETLNSFIDDSVSPSFDGRNGESNQPAMPEHFVSTPTMVTSLSLRMGSEKTAHPPLPKKNQHDRRNNPPPRSPRKNHRRNSPAAKPEMKSLLLESEYLVKLALGPSCTHVITSTGRWLVFGYSSDGLLALGGNSSHVFQPREVRLPLAFGPEQISSISIGIKHGVALTASGRAFTWGKSAHGALGQQSKMYIPIPQPVLFSSKTTQSARAGNALSSKLTRHLRGETDTSANPKTRNGNNVGSKDASSIETSPVAYVHAGSDMSVFILGSGSIQTCGRQSGRLGQGDVSNNVSSPAEIFGGIQLWRSGRTST